MPINPGFFEQLGRSPQVEAKLVSLAEQGKVIAQVTAPVETGEYRASFSVELVRGDGRSVARIVNDHPGALAIEARTGTLNRAGRLIRG